MPGGCGDSMDVSGAAAANRRHLSIEHTGKGKVMIKRAGFVVVVAVALTLCGFSMAETPRKVVVHAGHMLDVKTGKMLADQMLVIEDGKIASAGAWTEGKAPTDAVLIELPNATVLPGLIDTHTHLTMEPRFG